MKVSRFNKKVTFQKNETSSDIVGNHTNTWTDYYTCRGTISGEGGTEVRDAGVIVSNTGLSLTVRYCRKAAAIDETHYRVVIDGELYNIESVDHFSYKHQALKFKCQKVRR